jgi:hypothetical protein
VFDFLPESYSNARLVLYNYILLIIWIVSLLGNSLIIIVLSGKRNRSFSTSVYFISLAVADIWLNTSNTLTSYFVFQGYINYPSSQNDCYYRNWLSFSAVFVGPWILVVISIERMLSVFIPHKVKLYCTVRLARVIVLVVFLVFLLLGILHERVYVLKHWYGSTTSCEVKKELEQIYAVYIAWIISILKFILPLGIIFVCTVIIIFILICKNMNKTKTQRKSRDVTITLVVINVNIIFLITNGTYLIYHLIRNYIHPATTNESVAYDLFWESYLLALNEVNSAVNIFVYCFTGSKFRNDVKELVLGFIPAKLRKRDNKFNQTLNTNISMKSAS